MHGVDINELQKLKNKKNKCGSCLEDYANISFAYDHGMSKIPKGTIFDNKTYISEIRARI